MLPLRVLGVGPSDCGVVLRVLGVACECGVVMLPLRVLGGASE